MPAPVLPCLRFLRPCRSSRSDRRHPHIGNHVCWQAALTVIRILWQTVEDQGFKLCPELATRL